MCHAIYCRRARNRWLQDSAMENTVGSIHTWRNDLATAAVIDDDGRVRQVIHRILEWKRCHVAEAECAEHGLHLLEPALPPVAAALTDINTPGLSGWDAIDV